MKKMDSVGLLTICAWLGVVVVIVAIACVRYFSVIQTTSERPAGEMAGVAPDQTIPPNEPLGELGSHCGGHLRLPCRPGLQCSVDERQTQQLGTCVQSQQPLATAPRQLNEVCEQAHPCATGLYCKIGAGQSSCQVIDATAPKVDALKLGGTQFDDGIYRARTGQSITVNATTTNAVSVQMRLAQDGTYTDLGKLQKVSDTAYRGTFTVTPGMSGTLEISVTDPKGNIAMLSASVAALP